MCDKVLKPFVSSNIQPSANLLPSFGTIMISIRSRYLECLFIAQMELSLNFQIRHLIFISLYQTVLLFVGVNQRVVIGRDPFKLSITTLNHIIYQNVKIPDLSLLQSHRIRKTIFKSPGKLISFGLFFVFSLLLLEILYQIGVVIIIYI